ncbi:XRE family transcriptional regulator [Streptomyces sp. NPDC056930]|uniref:XRE family transcriptional regulator n=1 Tax=Streptomyces sp. NPDC056930 TaxID=3345967 RepID=UPI0036446506
MSEPFSQGEDHPACGICPSKRLPREEFVVYDRPSWECPFDPADGFRYTADRTPACVHPDAGLVRWLDAAMDADRIVAAGLDDDGGPHPLAGWVHTRDTAHMLAWALNGTTPPALAGRLPRPRRGPVAPSPQLATGDRAVFFDRLRATTEHAARQGERGVLLHRQALYLASYDRSPDAAAWTAHPPRTPRRPRPPGLVTAVGRRPLHRDRPGPARRPAAPARLHRPRPGRRRHRRGREAELLGAVAGRNGRPAERRHVHARPRPGRLGRADPAARLAVGLVEAPGFVDLYAHSLHALLVVAPWLPQAAGPLASPLRERTAQLLDGVQLSARSRRELGRVHYVLDNNRT